MSTGRGVGKEQRNILGTNVAAVNTVSRARAAFDAPRNLALPRCTIITGVAFQQNRHFCEVPWWPDGGAREDDVVHSTAAQRLRA